MTKLYTVGPVEMYKETLDIAAKQVPYFRTNEFSQVVIRTVGNLKTLLNCNKNDDVFFLTCSGTGAMEATIQNCLYTSDTVLIIDGGSFGHRFVELCEIHSVKYTVVKVDFGATLTRGMIEEVVSQSKMRYSSLLVNIHESSTGQLYDINMLSEFCQDNDMFFIVDAISSFLADPFDMRRFNIDVVILSSQKALSLAPGLSIVAISERMKKKVDLIPIKSMYFDFKNHIREIERGQTPFTPSVRVIMELNQRVQYLVKEGYNNEVLRTKALADDFREKVYKLGLSIPKYPLSNTLTPVIFDEKNANEIYNVLKDKYDIIVNPSGGELGDLYFRVAHIGNHNIIDNDILINAIEEILNWKKKI